MQKYLKLSKSIRPLFHYKIHFPQYYRFCEIKQNNVPPLKQNQKYKLLFLNPNYAAADVKKSWAFLANFPAFIMFAYNSMNGWTLGNGIAFAGLLSFGVIFNLVSYTLKSNLVYCVQADKNLEYIYFVMRMTPMMKIMDQKKFNSIVSNQQRYQLAQNYHPYKGKLSQIILQDLKGPIQQIKDSQVSRLQKDIIRFKIPRNKIRFILMLNQKTHKQLKKDKLQLNQQQLIQKYSKFKILAIVALGYVENNENISEIQTEALSKLKLPKFLIIQKKNLNKQGNYLLTSLALGLKDNTQIIKKVQTNQIDPKINENIKEKQNSSDK